MAVATTNRFWIQIQTLALVVLAVGLRLAHGPQLDGLDDAGYLDAAGRIAHGEAASPAISLFRFRVGMTYPLGWLVRSNLLALRQFWVLTLALDVIALLCIMDVAARLWGRRAAWIAGLLYAVYPLAIQQANAYYPTSFQVAGIALSLALLVAVGEPGTRAVPLAGLSGLVAGLSYLAKEDVAVAIVALAIATWMTGWRSPRVVLAFCIGAVAVFAAECAVYAVVEGQPLFRLIGTSGLGALNVSEQLPIAGIWKWHSYVRTLLLMPYQVGLFWWLGLVAVATGLASKDKPTRTIVLTLLLTFAYLQFGTVSLANYATLPKTPRYTAIATPFLVLVLTSWIDKQWAAGRVRRANLVMGLVVASSIPCVVFSSLAGGERTRNTMAAAQLMQRQRIDPVYTDFYSARLLNLLIPGVAVTLFDAQFPTNVMFLAAPPEAVKGHYVLVDHQLCKNYTSTYQLELPPLIARPPASWQRVWRHQAYPAGSIGRQLLESIRSGSQLLPPNPITARLITNIGDMIDDDEASLFLVPG